MSEEKVALRNYLKSRCNNTDVLLQPHPQTGKEVCVIIKKEASTDGFVEAVKKASNGDVRINDSAFSLRLEADSIQHFNFLLKC